MNISKAEEKYSDDWMRKKYGKNWMRCLGRVSLHPEYNRDIYISGMFRDDCNKYFDKFREKYPDEIGAHTLWDDFKPLFLIIFISWTVIVIPSAFFCYLLFLIK